MPLKLTIDKLDDAEESARQFYSPTADGKFRLAVDGVEELQKQAADARRAQEATLLDSELDRALDAVGVIKNLARGAKLLIKDQCKVVADGDKLKVVAGDGQDLAEFVRTWSSTDGRIYIVPAKGGDAAGGGPLRRNVDSGPNPWSRSAWNMTAQGHILSADPARAQRLAKRAGHQSAAGARRDHAR
jgi:hypothetical protein